MARTIIIKGIEKLIIETVYPKDLGRVMQIICECERRAVLIINAIGDHFPNQIYHIELHCTSAESIASKLSSEGIAEPF